VDLLLEAAAKVHGDGRLFAPAGTFPSPDHGDFPLHSDAERHYKHGPPLLQRYLPFWLATWIDRTKVMLLPLLVLLLPLLRTRPPVYRWRIRRRILRCYVDLRRIDLDLEVAVGGRLRSRRQVSKPSRPGMRISSKIRSGWTRSAIAIPS